MAYDSKELKRLAAESAVDLIESGMVLGLGTGSTVAYALKKIAQLLNDKTLSDIVGIPTSSMTEKAAKELGIPLTDFNKTTKIDLTIDGADEVDEDLNLIKGGGGALLREKVVAQASKQLVVIVDETKVSAKLGEKWAVPVEVIPFARNLEFDYLNKTCAKSKLRMDGNNILVTDEGNNIIDADFGIIDKPAETAAMLEGRAGVVEHGLFVGMADKVYIAGGKGVEVKHRKN